MSERTTPSPTVVAQRDRFAARRAGLPGVGRSAIDRRREAGMARFESLGLPTRKLEAWKYTDLRRLEKFSFASVVPDELAVPEALRGFIPAQGPSMVFVNGPPGCAWTAMPRRWRMGTRTSNPASPRPPTRPRWSS
jgi:Fe-S cluster assembly protein SufD